VHRAGRRCVWSIGQCLSSRERGLGGRLRRIVRPGHVRNRAPSMLLTDGARSTEATRDPCPCARATTGRGSKEGPRNTAYPNNVAGAAGLSSGLHRQVPRWRSKCGRCSDTSASPDVFRAFLQCRLRSARGPRRCSSPRWITPVVLRNAGGPLDSGPLSSPRGLSRVRFVRPTASPS
jgi:hypothetical protein